MMNKKRLIIAATVALLLVGTLGGVLGYTATIPKTDEIYDRVVELIEASYELNTVFYGAGLPVHKTDSAYAEFSHLYFDFQYLGDYEIVTEYAKFLSEDEIRSAAEKVYSKNYLETVLYNSAFVGYAVEDGKGGAAFAAPRYLEDNEWIYQSVDQNNYLKGGMRVYDYSSMRVIAPSNKKACYVSIDSYLPEQPELITSDTLRLVRQDDGLWYLDSFTG
jgi:hypothetical protein